ncbi:MAG: MBL fold metallo-hydrolase [Bdellovibrionales bacterium]|nr:MBL fold metallo-hydrolase [Bdellovibrionales bacterium]
MGVKITFLGAAGTVTGSKFLVEGAGKKILIDVGLFQGSRELRERNWRQAPVNLSKIDAVLLTHAHIDHTGMLPRYCSLGMNAPVFATSATIDLCTLLLPDSAQLQEEEAKWRKEHSKSRHHPPLPLYTKKDAEVALKLMNAVSFHKKIEFLPGVTATWNRMGHILGAASIQLNIEGAGITFSGDIGRYDVPILKNPEPADCKDLLLIESTYGNRSHSEKNPLDKLEKIINRTCERGGVVLIPAFAVGRTQLILYYLRELKQNSRIPNIPIIVDSPMASDATTLYRQHPEDYDEAALNLRKEGNKPFAPDKLHFIRDRSESIKLNSIKEPMVIISASGMLSGGRILHHLKHRISSPLNTLVFAGYQSPGGRGAWIKNGATSLRLLGEEVEIRAEVDEISGLSAHADREDLIKWCTSLKTAPEKIAIVHGEPEGAIGLKDELKKKLDWDAHIPKYLETMEI